MPTTGRTLAVLLLLAAAPAFAGDRGEKDERALLNARNYSAALANYSIAAENSPHAAVVAEYAYVLAMSGYAEPAVVQADRALIMDADDDEVLYFTAQVLAAAGLSDAAAELARPAPSWLVDPAPVPRLQLERRPGDFRSELDATDALMAQKRYVGAAARFHALTLRFPKEPLAWSGYAICLEKLGAYRAAARAAEKDMALNAQDEEAQQTAAAYIKDLLARPDLEAQKQARQGLKGRYLAFLGANYSKAANTDAVVNVNGRIGKFLTNRFDAALNFGYVSGYSNNDFNGANAGISGRYNTPLPGAPLNGTFGARLAYDPGPSDNVSFILSPGVSWFLPSGSFDLFVDFAVSGPNKGSRTWSFGYTAYFGGPKS